MFEIQSMKFKIQWIIFEFKKKQSMKFKEKSLEYKYQTTRIIFKLNSLKLKY